MQSIRIIARSSIRNKWSRKLSLSSIVSQNVEVQPKVENITIPPPSNVDKPLSPKIEQLVNAISNLTLIEVTELSSGLKNRLNLPDAPMLPVGFTAGGTMPVEEEEVTPQKLKVLIQ